MEYTCFDLEIKDKIAHIKMSRPDEFNSMNKAFWSELPHLVESISDDASARVIVLSGEGKHFCAGADFTRSSYKEESDPYERLYQEAVRLFKTKKPVIATIQGAAVGGGLGVALSADFRIACEESRFSANFSKLAFHQGFGTTVTLPRVVGNQKAKWMLLTSARVKGKEAFEIGLADFLVPQNELMSKAEELAKEINAAGPLGVQAIRETIKGDSVEKIEEIVKWELSEQNRLRDTADFQEGIKASLERRDPEFTGN